MEKKYLLFIAEQTNICDDNSIDGKLVRTEISLIDSREELNKKLIEIGVKEGNIFDDWCLGADIDGDYHMVAHKHYYKWQEVKV